MSSATRQQMEKWLRTIEVKGDKVLDIGGSQNPLNSKRLKTFEPEEYKILDLEVPHECKQVPDLIDDIQERIIRPIKKYFGDPNYIGSPEEEREKEKIIGYKESLPKAFQKYEEYFDIAFCLEVSEYWWNPFQALKNINKFLKKDGLLYLSSHFIYPVHNPVKEDYLRYTRQGIIKLLEEAGFYEINTKSRECGNDNVGNFNTNIFFSKEGMRPAKKYAKHFEVGNLVVARKK